MTALSSQSTCPSTCASSSEQPGGIDKVSGSLSAIRNLPRRGNWPVNEAVHLSFLLSAAASSPSPSPYFLRLLRHLFTCKSSSHPLFLPPSSPSSASASHALLIGLQLSPHSTLALHISLLRLEHAPLSARACVRLLDVRACACVSHTGAALQGSPSEAVSLREPRSRE